MKKLLLFIPVILFITLSGCSRTGCTDPDATNYDPKATKDCCCIYDPDLTLSIGFIPHVDDELYEAGKIFENAGERNFQINKLKMYISNIRFTRETADGYQEFAASDTNFLFSVDNASLTIPAIDGKITEIKFDVAVDEYHNKNSLPAYFHQGHPLAETSMHWSWNTGYIFFSLEGSVDTTATPDGTLNAPLVYHLGTEDLRRTVTIPVDLTYGPDLDFDQQVKIKADLWKMLEDLYFPEEYRTETMNNLPLAVKMADKIPDMFSLIP